MSKRTSLLRVLFVFFFEILIITQGVNSQAQYEENNQNHEVTIFVIPSLSSIDWSNPAMLFKSTRNCFLNAIWKKNYYIIGHTIVRISSPILPEPYYVAMSGTRPTEKVELLLIKKYGLGAMGSTIRGNIEPEKSIKRGIETYAKRKKVAYIKFKVNELTVCRILEFVEQYQKVKISGIATCNLYNGATWPRYENEGSGCSAFGMSVLDVANLLPAEASEWRVHVKIPMNLIGGEFNNNRKIKISSILHTQSWYVGSGVADVDYVDYKVYDPSIIFHWIINKRTQNNLKFQVDEENGMDGLIVDRQNMVVDVDEPLYLQRTDSNLFVRHYYQKIRTLGLK